MSNLPLLDDDDEMEDDLLTGGGGGTAACWFVVGFVWEVLLCKVVGLETRFSGGLL